MKNNFVIFLDIDGVLTSEKTRLFLDAGQFQCTFDQAAVGMIKEMCHKYNAKVVLISDWIKTFDYQQLKMYLQGQGLNIALHSDWRIRDDNKALGVRKWLDTHKNAYGLVIDNDHLYLDDLEQVRQVWTCEEEGLTYEDFKTIKGLVRAMKRQLKNN